MNTIFLKPSDRWCWLFSAILWRIKTKAGAKQPLKLLSASAILFFCAVSFDSVIILADSTDAFYLVASRY